MGGTESTLKDRPRALREDGLDALGDDKLLERYVTRGDEIAFAAMVARHGRRVLAACRQVLGRSAEVEDVFQKTFLLLATRAGTIRNPESLGHWLYGVAHRLAVRSRTQATRRIARERQAIPMSAASDEPECDIAEQRRVLHDEVDRLPEPLRKSILLCYLEGRSTAEAARMIGCPAGTVKDRLARGRALLRGRLARRGMTLSAALLLLLLPRPADAEEVPPWLVAATVEAARREAARIRRRASMPHAPRWGKAFVVAAGLTVAAAFTFAYVLSRPNPARGTWLRVLVDFAHKVCR